MDLYRVLSILVLCVCGLVSAPSARASLVYQLSAQVLSPLDPRTFSPITFSFTVPDFIAETTVIPGGDITVVVDGDGCEAEFISISNPRSSGVGIVYKLTGCNTSYNSGLIFSGGVFGPLDEIGAYTNGAPIPTVLTISGAPESQIPEPGSTGLAFAAIVAAVIARKRADSRQSRAMRSASLD